MKMMRCANCDHGTYEENFWPSDGNPAPHVCPECGHTGCHIFKPVRFNFDRDHKAGEYIGFEIRICYNDDDDCISNIMDQEHLESHEEEGTHLFWGVYGVNPDGMSEILGDFATEEYALDTVKKLGGKLNSSW
jgi:hypothetical protein